MPQTQIIKRTVSSVVVLLFVSLGLVGIAATLLPPEGTQTDLITTLLGLGFSSTFLFIAWAFWRWSKSCLLCQMPTITKQQPPQK